MREKVNTYGETKEKRFTKLNLTFPTRVVKDEARSVEGMHQCGNYAGCPSG